MPQEATKMAEAVAGVPHRRSDPLGNGEVILFEPDRWDRLLEGWLIHTRKQQEKHRLCARHSRTTFQRVSVPATVLSAVTTLPAVATLAEGPGASQYLIVATTTLAVLSAVFVAIQKSGEYDKVAESHRLAEFNYKDMIRTIEAAFAAGEAPNIGLQQEMRERLRVVDAQAPIILPKVDEAVELRYRRRRVVKDLAEEIVEPDGAAA